MKLKSLGSSNVALIYVALIGASLTIILFFIIREWEQKNILTQFNVDASDRVRAIENAIQDNNSALLAIGSFYEASRSVERKEFHDFTRGIFTAHPDILEFRWLQRVKDSELQDYEASMRKAGFTGFVVKELGSLNNLITASKRPEYFCVTYIEPVPRDKDIFGVDISSDPLRWEMMQKSRDTGEIYGTDEIRFIGDEFTGSACRFFLPIYRNELPHNTLEERRENLQGFVVLVFRIGAVVELSLKQLAPAGIDIYIYDATAKPGERIIYCHYSVLNKTSKAFTEEELASQKGLQYSRGLDFSGKKWKAICLATPMFMAVHQRYGCWVVLFAGLLLTVLAVFYLVSIIKRSAQVESLVKTRTGELNKANALNEALLKSIPFPMDIVDGDGNILYLSERMEDVAGKDALGKKCWSIYKDDKERCGNCPLIKGIEIGKTHSIEASGVLGGKVFQITHTGMLFKGKEAILEIFQDITEKKEIEEKLAELSTAVEQGPAVVVITDTEGNIQYVNTKFTQVTGYSFREVAGKNPRVLKSGEQHVEFYKNLWDTIKSGREWRGEFHNKKKDGQLYWEAASISPIKDAQGAITHFVAIKEDVTARKAVEGALVKANEQLMKLDQLKSDFVSTVSHELRTPLSITREGISLVIDNIPGKINDKQKEILLTSRDNIDRLARIISGLLDISKIEAGRIALKREQVNLADLVRQVVFVFESRIKEKGLKLKTDLPQEGINVYGDTDKLIQVLTNLLGNALKFTEKGSIEISVKEAGEFAECTVADTGCGISKDNLPKVFSKFQQFGRTAGSGEKGTGLGLSIAKGLVELHRGEIKVESALKQGSKFSFVIPKYNAERVFKEHIDDGVLEAIRKDSKISLIVVSMDNFAKIKAQVPAEKLSAVVKGMSVILKNSLHREGDIVAKDADEMIVLLSDCNKENALIVQGRLEQVLEEYLASQNLSNIVSLRFGCATFPDEAQNEDELLKKAKA